MSRGWTYKSGEWIVTCDVCGKQTFASDIKKRWDGLLVCSADYEPRHPQDFLKVRQDKISVPFSRPAPEDLFIDVVYVVTYVIDGYIATDYFEEL